MDTQPHAHGCDIGVQTTVPSPSSRSPILDHRLYSLDDSNSEWNFLSMETTSSPVEERRTGKGKVVRKPSNQGALSPEEDGYCSQEEGNDWVEGEDQSYRSPLKNAPSYQTYLALVPDLEGGDSGPETNEESLSPNTDSNSATFSTDSLSTSTNTSTSGSNITLTSSSAHSSPVKKVSDDQSGGRGDSTPLFEQSPASTPSELASPTNENLSIDDAERERLKTELAEIELDIEALRQTLRAKDIRAKEIRRKLGITPVAVLKNDVKTGWTNFKQSSAFVNTSSKLAEWNESITTSDAYSKTKTGFQSAGQKTGAAFTSFGSSISKKLGEVRESNAFKSFEEKVSTTASTIKTKVSGTKPEEESSFEDVLQSTASPQAPEPQTVQPLPEEKVPM